jgi:hypothetical protein
VKRLVPVAAAVVALAACGGNSTPARERARPVPDRRSELVVRVVTQGGFAAEAPQRGGLPHVSVFGDGRVVTVGPTTLEYPGPALPNVQELQVTNDGLARILSAAGDAGLLADPLPDYGDAGITDQATTTVTVTADGTTRRVDVYALDFTDDLTVEQQENRRRLQRFIELAGDPASLGDVVVPDSTRRHAPHALAVLSRPFLLDVETPRRDWPLGDLAQAGRPYRGDSETRCAVYLGDDGDAVLDTARGARENYRWVSGDESYQLTFRPLLPDERGCEDLERPVR